MTPKEEICSILFELELNSELKGWPLRELSQRGMNISRRISKNGDWLYLYFLELNLSQRKSIPAFWGKLFALKQHLFLSRVSWDDDLRRFSQINSSFARFAEKYAVKKN